MPDQWEQLAIDGALAYLWKEYSGSLTCLSPADLVRAGVVEALRVDRYRMAEMLRERVMRREVADRQGWDAMYAYAVRQEMTPEQFAELLQRKLDEFMLTLADQVESGLQ